MSRPNIQSSAESKMTAANKHPILKGLLFGGGISQLLSSPTFDHSPLSRVVYRATSLSTTPQEQTHLATIRSGETATWSSRYRADIDQKHSDDAMQTLLPPLHQDDQLMEQDQMYTERQNIAVVSQALKSKNKNSMLVECLEQLQNIKKEPSNHEQLNSCGLEHEDIISSAQTESCITSEINRLESLSEELAQMSSDSFDSGLMGIGIEAFHVIKKEDSNSELEYMTDEEAANVEKASPEVIQSEPVPTAIFCNTQSPDVATYSESSFGDMHGSLEPSLVPRESGISNSQSSFRPYGVYLYDAQEQTRSVDSDVICTKYPPDPGGENWDRTGMRHGLSGDHASNTRMNMVETFPNSGETTSLSLKSTMQRIIETELNHQGPKNSQELSSLSGQTLIDKLIEDELESKLKLARNPNWVPLSELNLDRKFCLEKKMCETEKKDVKVHKFQETDGKLSYVKHVPVSESLGNPQMLSLQKDSEGSGGCQSGNFNQFDFYGCHNLDGVTKDIQSSSQACHKTPVITEDSLSLMKGVISDKEVMKISQPGEMVTLKNLLNREMQQTYMPSSAFSIDSSDVAIMEKQLKMPSLETGSSMPHTDSKLSRRLPLLTKQLLRHLKSSESVGSLKDALKTVTGRLSGCDFDDSGRLGDSVSHGEHVVEDTEYTQYNNQSRSNYGQGLQLPVLNVLNRLSSVQQVQDCSDETSVNNTFECKECGKCFARRGTLKVHLRSHNFSNFKCGECGKVCSAESYLTLHLRTHSKQKTVKKTTREYPFQCKVCFQKFRYEKNMEIHSRFHVNKSPYRQNTCVPGFLHFGGNSFQCEECKVTFRTIRELKLHSILHSHKKPHECGICGERFIDLSHLSQHEKAHTDKEIFQCPVCAQVFREQESIIVHMETHKIEETFSCAICSKKFLERIAYAEHLQSHTNLQLYSCTRCNKKFSVENDLIAHEQKHFEENLEYMCQFCDQQFDQPASLFNHLMTH